MRAFWSGEIQFALINIPVKLYSSSKDITPHFHLIHRVCKTRISNIRRCEHCNIDTPWEDIGKGYEVAKDQYALFTPEELKALDEDANDKGVIDIIQTIEPAEVDLALVDKSYWIGPGAKRARGYELLRQTLDETGLLALARVRLRSRPRLCVLRPHDRLLSLSTLRYHAELIDAQELELPALEMSDKERELAKQLMTGMYKEFKLETFTDEHGALLLAAIEDKVNASDTSVEKEKAIQAVKPIDLAELLSRSVKEGKSSWGSKKNVQAD